MHGARWNIGELADLHEFTQNSYTSPSNGIFDLDYEANELLLLVTIDDAVGELGTPVYPNLGLG